MEEGRAGKGQGQVLQGLSLPRGRWEPWRAVGRGGQTGGGGSRGTRAEVTAQVQASNEGTDQVEAEKGGRAGSMYILDRL